MTADAPGEESAAGDGDDATWLRRLYEFESGSSEGPTTTPEGPAGTRSPDPDPTLPRWRSTRADRIDATGRDADRRRLPPPDREAATATDPSTASPLLRAVRETVGVSSIRLTGTPADHAFGRTVRASVSEGASRHPICLRLFRRPDTADEGIEPALETQLDRWDEVATVEGVVPIIGSGTEPRPWACSAPLGPTAGDYERRSIARALRDARHIAATLRALHDRGVVHAGLDPDTVVYPGRGADRTAPLLDAPGLVDVYRRYVDPATLLDPRYAAPEYYDDDRGVVDRASDVYGFGALLFTLCTGRPPYDGDPDAVREAVLSEAVPRPSSVDPRVPERVDDLVERAMAPDKFDRFDTATALTDAVDAVCGDHLEE